ncbi:hypothetical protein [Pseudoneobacillus rhizosphaerae]|uniref:VCBS repeat-containing protein n=1 Tax=Pseudoneobacillus rhizosphaerae TaxID=2880968 RepID=A0A9C7L902_9BACI|nr:hypothetical protein [Pseudoneobacillus rhizosphaerae]CAG9606402.1 hypothetical protein NEOCIP111885_00090 [Pseudoneobacillus rhizosphaerae]
MKKELLFAFTALFLMSLTAITGVYAVENDPEMVPLVNQQQEDINGDGQNDEILLLGLPYQKNDIVYKEFSLTIHLSNGKTYQEMLPYGLDPKLDLMDINHDGIKDVFISIPTGQSGGMSKHYLYSAKENQISNIPIPELEILGQFKNGYKAQISIPATKKSFVFDLMVRKEMYESLGMYQNGKLNEPTELMVLPYKKLKPLATKGLDYGLKGVQMITGTSKTDKIAYVETSWYYRNGDWKLINTEVKEVRK